jgi:hypothetical protein
MFCWCFTEVSVEYGFVLTGLLFLCILEQYCIHCGSSCFLDLSYKDVKNNYENGTSSRY